MDMELLERMRKRNYLSKEDNYVIDKDVKSVLMLGAYYDKLPKLTVIMPTFKRGTLLIRALKSILNQKDYDDYQILIVDNENVFGEETETERIIKSFDTDKIIYYRNDVNIGIYANWNRCTELAQTEWICMVHDDDVLVENHLSVMMKIIDTNPDIDFLACDHRYLDEREKKLTDEDIEACMKAQDTSNTTITHMSYFDFSDDFVALYLGGVYRRSCALDLGGFTPRSTLMEEYTFVSKMAYYYNVYSCNLALYGYYWGQNESLKLKIWMDQSVWQYFLTDYIAKQRKTIVRGLFRRRAKYMIIDLVNRHNSGKSFLNAKCEIDTDEFIGYCGIKSFEYSKIFKKANSAIVNIIESKRNRNKVIKKIEI